jgi:hypothetical protein
MNSLVALPIAAAIPTAAPAMDFPIAPATAPTRADLELVRLAEQLIAAVAESRRLSLIADEMKYAHRKSGFPEVLRIRPSDAELGRTPWESTDEFWHRPCDIDKWRISHSFEHDVEDRADGFVMNVRKIKPSEELRERAEEILAAYDKWDLECQKKPSGYKAAKRAYERAADIETKLEQRIDAIKATTVEGMLAKARCAEVYHFENGTVDFGRSIAEDLLALSADAPTTAPALVPAMQDDLDSLWKERMDLTRKGNEKARDYPAALDSLPGWARSGPESIDSSGHRCGGEVGWPEIAEFELPSGSDTKLIRISPHQIKKEFDLSVSAFDDADPRRQKVRETFRQKMRSLIARLRQKQAEEARAGLPELDKEIDRLCDQRFDLDERIKVLEPSVNLAVAGILIEVSFYVRLGESVDDPDNELRAALIPIRALHPLLTGAVRETVDIMFNNPTVPLEDLDVMRA